MIDSIPAFVSAINSQDVAADKRVDYFVVVFRIKLEIYPLGKLRKSGIRA